MLISSTLKGTADPNSTITVYDGSTKLGTTTASATGSWDYITQVLTDAKHTLTATATIVGSDQRRLRRAYGDGGYGGSGRAGPGQRFRGQYQPRSGVWNG